MSEIITVINMKGGVGKTTLSVNVAFCLGLFHNKKVLLVDIDPQFNTTQYLVEQPVILKHFKEKKTIYDVLIPNKEEEISLAKKAKAAADTAIPLTDLIIPVYTFPRGQLDLIPSSLKLSNFEAPRGTENLLKKFLKTRCAYYDFIIIDCAPTLSLLTLSAYLASEHYLIPIKPDYLSSLGLPLLNRGLESYEQLHGHTLNLLGIVFTMVNNRLKMSTEVMNEIKGSGWECFKNASSYSTNVAKSVKSLSDFYRYAKYDKHSSEFRLITRELLNKL